MGRPALSPDIKAAKGTLRKCREASRCEVPEGAQLVALAPPKGIPADARNAWKLAVQTCPFPLAAIDAAALERWCRLWAQWRKLQKVLEHEGYVVETEVGPMTRREFGITEKIGRMLAQLEAQLGFSPVPRTRLHIPDKSAETNEFDDF